MCDKCCHGCCGNGESGKLIFTECYKCEQLICLCTNNLSEEELLKRINGEACGCSDVPEEEILCYKCRRNN